jgi:hypothetical protein
VRSRRRYTATARRYTCARGHVRLVRGAALGAALRARAIAKRLSHYGDRTCSGYQPARCHQVVCQSLMLAARILLTCHMLAALILLTCDMLAALILLTCHTAGSRLPARGNQDAQMHKMHKCTQGPCGLWRDAGAIEPPAAHTGSSTRLAPLRQARQARQAPTLLVDQVHHHALQIRPPPALGSVLQRSLQLHHGQPAGQRQAGRRLGSKGSASSCSSSISWCDALDNDMCK